MWWEFRLPQRVHAVAAQDQGQMCPDVAGAGELRLRPAWGWGGAWVSSESSMLLPMAPSCFYLLLLARGTGVGDRVRMRLEEPTSPHEGGSTLQAWGFLPRQGGCRGPSPTPLPLPSLGTTL